MTYSSKNQEIVDFVENSGIFKNDFVDVNTVRPGTLICGYPGHDSIFGFARPLFTTTNFFYNEKIKIQIMTIVSIRKNPASGKIFIKTVEHTAEFWCFYTDKFYLTYHNC